MTDNITLDTNFDDISITNDYPCLVSNSWTATLDNDGVTIYSNGTNHFRGPVNLIGGSLIIKDKAIADGIIAINNGISPKITVQNGAILKNSDLYNVTIIINNGGLSENNNFVASNITLENNSTSSNDHFYKPQATSVNSGILNLSQLPSEIDNHFQVSKGLANLWNGNLYATNITINNPDFASSQDNIANAQTIFLGSGGQFGNTKLNPTQQYNHSQLTVTNDYKTFIGGSWTSTLNDDNVTIYNSDNITVEGPINLISISELTIKAGSIVDNITITGDTQPIIINYGTIQNSFISNGYIDNQSDALSSNNTYISTTYYGRPHSTTQTDIFYVASETDLGVYRLLNLPSDAPQKFLLNGNGNIYLYEHSIWDDSYAGTSTMVASSQLYIYKNYSSNVSSFLNGTMINTPSGYVSIEDIQVGDHITVYNQGKHESQPVIWKGYNTVHINSDLSGNETNYPIRIVKNAVAEGIPYKDLLVTPEHCLFFNGYFVPVHMLVNGKTIFYDHSITYYTYYHIETDIHSVIIADGMLSESYLDIGNRQEFNKEDNSAHLHTHKKSWNIDSAAPLAITKDVVEPIFNQITRNIDKLYLSHNPQGLPTTNDSNLYLITDRGVIIKKPQNNKGRFIFRIPPNTKNVRLISRTSQPSKIPKHHMHDKRQLGVLVNNITLLEQDNTHTINTHLTSTVSQGWHTQENTSHRWTNGDALLELPKLDKDNMTLLIIHVLAGGPYLLENHSQQDTLRNVSVN